MSEQKMSAAAQARKNAYAQQLGSKPISKEKIVLALMPVLKETVQRPHRTDGKLVTYQVRMCPNKDACKSIIRGERGLFEFQDKSGYTVPYNHLMTCCFDKNPDRIINEYWEAISATSRKQSTLSTAGFSRISSVQVKQDYTMLSQKDKELHDWIEMIIMDGFPLNCVTKQSYRRFYKGHHSFGIKNVRDVILAMTVQVEEILANEMKAAGKISIVHDAWSKFGSHFFALFATYKATRVVVEDGLCKEVTKPVISLLSVAPLHTPVREIVDSDGYLPTADEAEVEESTEFTADAHAHHITDILESFYGISVAEFVTNQTADSASVNLSLAKKLKIAHVNCENHLLNNELKLWLKDSAVDVDDVNPNGRTFGPGTVCNVIHKCMVDLKTNKNRSILRKLTDLVPTIGCQTRWASMGNMVNKYNKMKDAIAQASTEDEADVTVPPTSPYFTKSLKKTSAILSDINYVSVNMQKCMATLSECEKLQQVVIALSENNRDNIDSDWYGNSFGKVYIATDSAKRPDKAFVSAVIKMQRRQGTMLNHDETEAVKKWLPQESNSSTVMPGTGTNMTAADMIAQMSGNKTAGVKRNSDEMSVEVDDCFDHIIGSAAEVERLWSIARYLLTTLRSQLSPILFEALLFLRLNRTLWNERTVQMACLAVREQSKNDRLEKKLKEAADHEALVGGNEENNPNDNGDWEGTDIED